MTTLTIKDKDGNETPVFKADVKAKPMMKKAEPKKLSIQEYYLSFLIKFKVRVNLTLMDGKIKEGVITHMDKFTLLTENGSLINKHAVICITPQEPISLFAAKK